MMASLTQRNFDHARQGLFERDEDHCNTAIADDEEIDLLEVQMDKDGMSVLMRFQPVASDLRMVIAMMKISVNLERLSDLVTNLARRARKVIALPPLAKTDELAPLFDHKARMLDDAVKAFSTGNLALVNTMKERDKELTAKSHEFASDLTSRMSFEVEGSGHGYLELIFILRYLEQMGNLCTNLGEDVLLAFSKDGVPALTVEERQGIPQA
ncbi:MAG: hypothetical protein BGO12_08055 [Verrucomicrobia bacterium 61-8]|nr:MAG: hypothetical protein BGO12_08055 [Verrucomicrobia bacterium 61-8]